MRKKIFLSFLALSCALLVLLTGVLVFGAYRLEQRQLADSLATEADTLASALETTQDNRRPALRPVLEPPGHPGGHGGQRCFR